MITRESITVKMSGASFSPSEAERATGLSLSETVEPGEIMTRGRDKGQPSPYGYANLSAADGTASDTKLADLLDDLLPHLDTLRSLGADEIWVYAGYWWRDQCNLTFWPSAVTKLGSLAALGMTFWVSCYEDSDDSPPVAVEPAAASRPRGLAHRALAKRQRVPPS